MSKLGKKQVRERIETYLAEHPGATSAEIGKFLGVSKQRALRATTIRDLWPKAKTGLGCYRR